MSSTNEGPLPSSPAPYYVLDHLKNPADPDCEGPFLEIHQGRVHVSGVDSWHTTTREWHEVFAFNLVGLVSVVDFQKSNITSYDGDFMMDSSIRGFEVDPNKARDLAMFRLAENCMTVLVHQ